MIMCKHFYDIFLIENLKILGKCQFKYQYRISNIRIKTLKRPQSILRAMNDLLIIYFSSNSVEISLDTQSPINSLFVKNLHFFSIYIKEN